ncbi:MAG: GTP pyrophosphokinase family protein [Clostridia bacterium]|nr:GTP pyrophosphokinase family protein [Clostridia bacterium]
MNIYQKAQNQVLEELIKIKEAINKIYGYEAIHSIASRIKTPNSIVRKMKKKNYSLTYKNLIEKINDIAGIRIICPLKNDIYHVVDIIEQMPNIKIIKKKDYVSKPKESGYSGYHLIVETPVELEGRNLPIKVEIQIRTMAMDFWATNEHKMKYKTNKKLSFLDSKKLTIYAKILNILDNKMMNIYEKQRKS